MPWLPTDQGHDGQANKKPRAVRWLLLPALFAAFTTAAMLVWHSSGWLSVQAPSAMAAGRAAVTMVAMKNTGSEESGAAAAAVVSTPTRLRGLVQKAGALHPDLYHPNSTHLRQAAFKAWAESRARRQLELEQGNTSDAGTLESPPPPPVWPGCHVFVNHAYRFIYLRHPKSASTSVLKFFGGKCKDGASPYNSSCLLSLHNVGDERIPKEEVAALWPNYTVFTFVRNPFKRAVSSYKMLMRDLEWKAVPAAEPEGDGAAGPATGSEAGGAPDGSDGSGGSSSNSSSSSSAQDGAGRQQRRKRFRFQLEAARAYRWGDFCRDPSSLNSLCRQDRKCRRWGDAWVHLHIGAQVPCMVAPDGGLAVDFVGSVERVDEDMARLLDLLDQRRAAGVPPLPRFEAGLPNINGVQCVEREPSTSSSPEPPETYCTTEQFYSGRHAACLEHIKSYYRADMETLF